MVLDFFNRATNFEFWFAQHFYKFVRFFESVPPEALQPYVTKMAEKLWEKQLFGLGAERRNDANVWFRIIRLAMRIPFKEKVSQATNVILLHLWSNCDREKVEVILQTFILLLPRFKVLHKFKGLSLCLLCFNLPCFNLCLQFEN